MITPSFAITATERVLPNMALDFTTAVLDSRVTFTRAGNTATRVNSSGVIENVNANLPRFDFDPTTLACNGLLMEDARTNQALYSEQFDNAAWTKTFGPVTANVAVSPDGTSNADLLTTDGTAAEVFVAQTISSGATISGSIYLKPAGITIIEIVLLSNLNFNAYGRAKFDISNGTISVAASSSNGGTNASAQITPAGNGWYRCSVTVTYPATVLAGIRINATAATGGYYLWGAQFETGAFLTSYIPTVASQVTRSADVAVMTGTNFSSWYNASQGAFVVESLSCAAVGARFVSVTQTTSGLTADNTIYMDAQANIRGVVFSGSTAVAAMAAGARPARGTLTRASLAYALDNYGVSLNGATPVTDSAGALPVVTNNQLEIGQLAGGFTTTSINSHMRKISFWPQRLINAEVQAFTK
jgi:hypothetical protein